jgi:hypothetical protein
MKVLAKKDNFDFSLLCFHGYLLSFFFECLF